MAINKKRLAASSAKNHIQNSSQKCKAFPNPDLKISRTGISYLLKRLTVFSAKKLNYTFDKITITQEWYYNDAKNIVFCKIPSAIISLKKKNEDAKLNEDLQQIKLVF